MAAASRVTASCVCRSQSPLVLLLTSRYGEESSAAARSQAKETVMDADILLGRRVPLVRR